MPIDDPREDSALDALLAASLRLSDQDVCQEQVNLFLKHGAELPSAYLRVLEERGADAADNIIATVRDSAQPRGQSKPSPQATRELYMAMNRKNLEDKHSMETEQELERRRREAREKLKKKKS